MTSEECFVKVMFGENTNTHPRHDSSDQLRLSSPTPVSQQGPLLIHLDNYLGILEWGETL